MNSISVVMAAAAVLVLQGCAAPAPVDQIKYFSQAFASVNTLGQPLLDDLAIAERRQGREIAVRRAQGKSLDGANKCPRDNFPKRSRHGPSYGMRPNEPQAERHAR